MSAVRSCYRPPKRRPHVICSMGSFFLPFSFFLYGHVTSCIRDSLHFARRFAPSKCVRCGTSSILLSPTKKKASCASRRDAFLLPFPSHLIYHLTSCIRAHDHLRVALLLQMMFAAEPVQSCYRPPKESITIRSVVLFSYLFPFSLRSYNLLHPRLTIICASLCSFK